MLTTGNMQQNEHEYNANVHMDRWQIDLQRKLKLFTEIKTQILCLKNKVQEK